MRYYWDTIRTCVRPEVILAALKDESFDDAKRHVELAIFSEYSAVKPPAAAAREASRSES
jgi:demethylmenaquinone methyltransferase/2-methoxy-6-polyprenyl-1,4-benzoquinol methylase